MLVFPKLLRNRSDDEYDEDVSYDDEKVITSILVSVLQTVDYIPLRTFSKRH